MASHLRRRRLAARAGSAATFVLVVVACVTSVAATGDGSSFLHGLEARQAGAAVQITSDLWAKCRQPVPCVENQNITAKYDVDACVAVAKRWGTDESEDVASYEAIGPYTANNVTNCQVFVSNLGAPSITFSRKDMAAAIERLSAQCVQESAAHNSVICDMDYNGGSVHLEVLPLGEQDMIAPVTGTGSAAGAGADTAAAAATDSTGSTTDSGSKSPTSTDSLGALTGAGLSDGASSATDPASSTTSTSSATETTPDSSSGASTPSSDSASGASETAGTGTTDTNDLGTTGSTRRRARALETSRVYPTVRPRRIALPSWTL